MFVGGSRGLDQVKRKQVVDWRGHLVDVEPRPLSKKAHWSTSLFAHELRRDGLARAKEYLACMKRDFDLSIAHGPRAEWEVNASHYLGRAPYWLQFIAASRGDH